MGDGVVRDRGKKWPSRDRTPNAATPCKMQDATPYPTPSPRPRRAMREASLHAEELSNECTVTVIPDIEAHAPSSVRADSIRGDAILTLPLIATFLRRLSS